MALPWKDPNSGVWHLRQRTPRDLLDRVRGYIITLPIGDGATTSVKVGEIVKVSLRTKDDRVAKLRHAVADAALRTFWEQIRTPDAPALPAEPSGRSAARSTREVAPVDAGMPWEEAVERFGPGTAELLVEIGIPPTAANQAAQIAETASVMDEAFAMLRAKVGRPRRQTSDLNLVPLKPKGDSGGRSASTNPTITISDVWDRYRTYHVEILAPNTLHRYSASILKLAAFFDGRDVRSITGDDLYSWAEHRRDVDQIQPRTINTNDLVAASSVFSWAAKRQGGRIVNENPVKGISLDIPRRAVSRERVFRTHEITAILQASLAIQPSDAGDANEQAKRWCPWLAAYSGARISELTGLTTSDIRQEQGHWIMFFGRTKNMRPRSVPIHEHIIEQGFIEFVRQVGSGPLFYNSAAHAADRRTPPYEIRARKVADWVRRVAHLDLNVDPNHGWRHTFKTRAIDVMDERVRDAIVGHSAGSVARRYEDPPVTMTVAAMQKYPRYEL